MLNKKKPFGEVHGHAPFQYMQDDKYFNGQGYEVDESGKLLEAVPEPELGEGDAVIQEDTTPEKDTRTQMIEMVEKMTVDAIKLKLEAFEVEFDKKALKADLVTMLVDEELAD